MFGTAGVCPKDMPLDETVLIKVYFRSTYQIHFFQQLKGSQSEAIERSSSEAQKFEGILVFNH